MFACVARGLSGWLFCLTLLNVWLALSQVTTPGENNGNCDRFTVNDLGSTEELRQEGLVSSAHLEGDAAPSDAPAIQILDYHVVCESVGPEEKHNQQCFTESVVVEYLYQIAPREPVENRTSQFQFECRRSQDSPGFFGEPYGVVHSTSFSADFETEPDIWCGHCVDPDTVLIQNTDDVTHCTGVYNKLYSYVDTGA